MVAGMRRRRHAMAFLCCVSDEAKFRRLRSSLQALVLPSGVEVDVFVERGVSSLPAAYNRLLRAARDWRYKAYLHQDVVVLNRHLVPDVLRVFETRTIGLIGAAGCRYLPESCVWWDGSGVFGNVLELDEERPRPLVFEPVNGDYERVEAVDGLCLITQYDLPWDEHVAPFHFYDVAQATRFVLAGYDVVVPRQAEPWFAHDATVLDDRARGEFFAARDAFRARYGRRRERFARGRIRRRGRQLVTKMRTRIGPR
jgi:Glycosyltransferase like family